MSTSTLPDTKVVELNTIGELLRYQREWETLLGETPEATLFQTLAWLAVYWKHFGQTPCLRTLLVFEGSRLAGAIPLAERTVRNRLGTVRVLGYPLDNWGTRYGPIGASVSKILHAGLRWLSETERTWDVLELGWTSESQLPQVETAFGNAGLPTHQTKTAPVSEIDLSSGWDSYWSSRTSKHRNNVRRAEKKLAQHGTITVHHHCGETDARWDMYEMCEQVASKSWQGGSSTGNTLSHNSVRDFLRDTHEMASARRGVSMHVILVDQQPAAFAYNYVLNGSVYALRMGYAPQFAAAGPGLHLIHEVVREAARLGYERIDLGEGDARYKHNWRTGEVQTYHVSHYRRHSLLAQTLRLRRHWFA